MATTHTPRHRLRLVTLSNAPNKFGTAGSAPYPPPPVVPAHGPTGHPPNNNPIEDRSLGRERRYILLQYRCDA